MSKKNEMTLDKMRATLESMLLSLETSGLPAERHNPDRINAAAHIVRAIVTIDQQRELKRLSRKMMKWLEEMIARHDAESAEDARDPS